MEWSEVRNDIVIVLSWIDTVLIAGWTWVVWFIQRTVRHLLIEGPEAHRPGKAKQTQGEDKPG